LFTKTGFLPSLHFGGHLQFPSGPIVPFFPFAHSQGGGVVGGGVVLWVVVRSVVVLPVVGGGVVGQQGSDVPQEKHLLFPPLAEKIVLLKAKIS